MTKPMYTSPETMAKLISESPWGVLGDPEDVAKVAVFLVSEDAAFVTGVAMPIDGGWAAG
jgi:NAD(P)-dependent dehydrogenase (short-subunit alcohol dehydrogenase family)